VDPHLSGIVSDSAVALLKRLVARPSYTALGNPRSTTPGVDDGARSVVFDDASGIPIIIVTPQVAVALQKLSLDLEVWAAGEWGPCTPFPRPLRFPP
jgi:ABC-type uncharacterized transport system YnjBCD ATPase subunit